MDTKKINQMIRISKMYYELHCSQLEIAAKEGISKSSVSRILKSAMDLGMIEVRIKDAVLYDTSLEEQLVSAFPIQRAVIVSDPLENSQILLQDVCAALVEDLPRFIDDHSVLGVAWGNTLAVLAKQLPRIQRTGVSVIQLNGGFSRAVYESGALDILKNFVECVGGSGYQIPAPAMVSEPFIADALKQDSQISQVLAMAEQCQCAVFSVGSLERPSVLYEMGIIDDDTYAGIRQMGGAGDCCSHFIGLDGKVLDQEMDSRVVAAPIETIRKIPNKLLVASGIEKAQVVAAALKGGLADSLYIDAPTAREMIRQINVSEPVQS